MLREDDYRSPGPAAIARGFQRREAQTTAWDHYITIATIPHHTVLVEGNNHAIHDKRRVERLRRLVHHENVPGLSGMIKTAWAPPVYWGHSNVSPKVRKAARRRRQIQKRALAAGAAPTCRCDDVDDEHVVYGWPAAVHCPIHDSPGRPGEAELARAADARDAP